MKRRMLSTLLCLIMILSMLPAGLLTMPAQAASEATFDDITVTYDRSTETYTFNYTAVPDANYYHILFISFRTDGTFDEDDPLYFDADSDRAEEYTEVDGKVKMVIKGHPLHKNRLDEYLPMYKVRIQAKVKKGGKVLAEKYLDEPVYRAINWSEQPGLKKKEI